MNTGNATWLIWHNSVTIIYIIVSMIDSVLIVYDLLSIGWNTHILGWAYCTTDAASGSDSDEPII